MSSNRHRLLGSLPRRGAWWLLCAALALASAPGRAAPDRLQSFLDGMQSLQARFVQTVLDEGAEPLEESSGQIAVRRPDRFRLEYNQPYRQLYVADGSRVWFYDQDLEQITVKPQEGMLSNTPAMVLSNPQELQQSFTVVPLGERDGLTWFELQSKTRDTNFERIRLAFAGETLRVMELVDALGQTTRLRFADVRYNTAIPDQQFSFTPPAGVDVIGE